MAESFAELATRMFVGPVWPASLLVGLLILYTMMALVGLIDLDFDLPDADLDLDFDAGDGLDLDFSQGIGAATLRWMNLGRVPLLIWGGLFTVVFWSISYGFWHLYDVNRYNPTWIPSVLLSIRNGVLAVLAVKVLTQPMVGWFAAPPAYDADHLIGATCEISSFDATADHGQAKFRTDAAPLLLNVRVDGPKLNKGDEARIVGFDPHSRTYRVTAIELPADKRPEDHPISPISESSRQPESQS